ncbi:MAG: glycosyltransferase family 4 protein, partial [Lachnospiraceae bacterium]|nr:glycosyltransferase family 4 protein [Lachnospiraceae bacterium]
MLADYVDLTVIYSEGELPPNARFTPLYIPKRTIPINLLVKRTTVIVSKKSYYKIAKDFDVVICIAYYRWLDMIMLESLPHKYKLIYWGIGVAASYGVPYDSSIPFAKETFKHAQKVDAMLFYSDYPVKKYASMGLNPQKMFVANNTVQVASLPYTSEGRNSILFIGTLYKEKNVNELIKAY